MRLYYVTEVDMDRRLERALRELGHSVEAIVSEEVGGPPMLSEPDAVIVDLEAPSTAWGERLAAVWPGAFQIQVVRADDRDGRIAALRAGADACFARPYQIREIAGRLHAAGRRAPLAPADSAVRFELRDREAVLDGCAIRLTAREAMIVNALARHPGLVLTAGEIAERIFGDGEARNSSVSAAIARLGSRTARQDGWRLISAVRGLGYRLEPRRATKEIFIRAKRSV